MNRLFRTAVPPRPAFLAVAIAACLTAASAARGADMAKITQIGQEELRRIETPHPAPSAAWGAPVWQDVVSYPKATYIAVHFERFDLAPGEHVEIATPDGRFRYTFEGLGKPRTGGTFWATHVPGDTCLVTYYGGGKDPGFGYTIDKFAHGFPSDRQELILSPDDTHAICGGDNSLNAKCYQATEPMVYNKSKAVLRLLSEGTGLCTGWLVGCDGHIMTNNHCIVNQTDADNIDYEIMAEGATCATNCDSDGGCPGTIIASGATLIKTDVNLDYSLVLPAVNVSGTYGYLKLRNGPPVMDERVYVPSHPLGWGKHIAVVSDNANDQSGYCEINALNQPACVAGSPFLDVSYYADTQGGSSGAPVISYNDQRVVAIHHCNAGGGACPNTGVPMNLIIADLQATNDLPSCAVTQFAGIVELGASAYRCSDFATITVTDDSLVGHTTQNVTIVSTTETAPTTVTLTATPAGSSTFVGGIQLTTLPAAGGDGLLSVNNGDTITVTYIDADDGTGGMNIPVTDEAGVDCIAPVITNVQTSGIGAFGVVVNWDTNEPADSSARRAIAPGPPSTQFVDAALTTSHHLPLSGLVPCTNYVYDVTSHDVAGNTTTANNGGAYYAFTTVGGAMVAPASTDTPHAIPDNNQTGYLSTINVAQNLVVVDAEVTVNITHSYDGDLVLQLIPPVGAPVLLSNLRGGQGNSYVNTTFDDEASLAIADGTAPYNGSFRPETPLSAVDGINAAGAWRLRVSDLAQFDTGTLENWTLTLTLAQQCGASLQQMSRSIADACSAGGPGNANGTVDPGEDALMSVRLRNNGNVALTGITGTLSTSTPGVTVTRPAASYPNLAPGAAAFNALPDFAYTVGTGVPCGSLINFTLQESAAQGTTSENFQVRVGAASSAVNTYPSSDVPKLIPDNNLTGVTSLLPISNTANVTDVNVQMNITHTYDGDIIATLIGPNNVRVELTSSNGLSGHDYTNTIFDDSAATSITDGSAPFAGTFRPEGVLSSLNGIPANGTWKLEVKDTGFPDSGTLNAWSLILSTENGFACSACGTTAPTGEPVNQNFSANKTTMTWETIPGAGFYSIYRGSKSQLPALLTAAVDSCARMTSLGTSTGPAVTEIPSAGEVYWYLVRAANSAGEATAGNATAGPRIQNSSGACP